MNSGGVGPGISPNAAFQWLMMSIKNRYEPAYLRLEDFLMSIGRRKFIKPLYEELAKTPEGRERALAIGTEKY